MVSNRPPSANPARNAVEITPSDDDLLAQDTRAVYVGGAGDLTVRMAGGQTVTFSSLSAGALLPIEIDKVLETGTTATGIVGLY